MSRWRSTWRIALYDARLMVLSSRFVILLVVAYIFMDMMMKPFRQLAAAFELGLVPAGLPFYLSDISFGNIALLLLVLLFSDIPLKTGSQNFLMQRGRSLAGSGAGHVLALFLAGGVFVLEQLLLSVPL